MIDFVSRPLSDSAIVVEVSGRLTKMDRGYFFDCIGDLVDSGYKHIIIECHKLGYLNSSGLAALLMARKRAIRNGGWVYLTHLNSSLAEILEVTKLGRLLAVCPTTEDAFASLENSAECVG